MLAWQPRDPVRDTHFRVEGPVVEQLAEAFARSWMFATGEDLRGASRLPCVMDL